MLTGACHVFTLFHLAAAAVDCVVTSTVIQLFIRALIRSKHKKVQTNAYLFNTDTQYANFRGNPLYQATKRHLNNRWTLKNDEKEKKKTYLVLVEFLQLLWCLEDCWHSVSLIVCSMSFSGTWRLPFCLVESVMTVYHALASVNLKNLEWQYTIFWPLLVWRLWNDSISFSLMELLATLFLVYHEVYKKAKYAAQTLRWPLYFPQDTKYVLYSVVR